MAGVSDKPPRPSDPRASREAELAEALRANLRRRKAPSAVAPKTAQQEVKEEAERADPPLPPPTRDG